jgi:lipoprotein signal peptidase
MSTGFKNVIGSIIFVITLVMSYGVAWGAAWTTTPLPVPTLSILIAIFSAYSYFKLLRTKETKYTLFLIGGILFLLLIGFVAEYNLL